MDEQKVCPAVPLTRPRLHGTNELSQLVWDESLLQHGPYNSVPDVLLYTMTPFSRSELLYIPVFTGAFFNHFIHKFEMMRAVLGWNELTARAYLLRAIREPLIELRERLRPWRYEACVLYLKKYYASLYERDDLPVIEQVLRIRREPAEPLVLLAARIVCITNGLQMSEADRDKLSSAAFRGALADDLELVEVLEIFLKPAAADMTELQNQLWDARVYEHRFRGIHLVPLITSLSSVSSTTSKPETVRIQPIRPRMRELPAGAHADTPYDQRVVLRTVERPLALVDKVYLVRNGTLHVKLLVVGLEEELLALVDTGAAVSIIPESTYKKLPKATTSLSPTDLDIRAGNDTEITCSGTVQLTFAIRYYVKQFHHHFYVCGDDTSPILGMDFLAEHDTCIHLAEEKFSLDDVPLATFDADGELLRRGEVVVADRV